MVADCERPRTGESDLCSIHQGQWAAENERGVGMADAGHLLPGNRMGRHERADPILQHAAAGTIPVGIYTIPEIASVVGEMTVFQRTPNWLAPTLDYHEDFPTGQQWLLNNVPYYSQWYRFWLFWRGAETLRPMAEVGSSPMSSR